MSRDYVLTTVLRQMPASYLDQFFQRLNLLAHFDFREYTRSHVPALLKALEDCPPDDRAGVHSHLRDIFSLSNPDGAEIIFDQVAQKEPARLAEVASVEHVYARAMWLYLEFGGVREGLFEACLSLNEAQLQRYSASKRVQNLPSLVPVSSPEVLRELEIAIAAIYRQQGRGMSCRVRYYRRNHPERHYFLASQEDFAHTELQFRGDDLHRVGRRATVLVAYVYYPEKGVLELSAPGNQLEGRSLQGAFCRGIVGLSGVPSRTSIQPHRLNTLLSPDIAFALEPDDNIASVTVVGVRLTCAFDPRIRILFERPNGETTSVREWINTTAVQLAPPLSYWNVSLVRFHVRFRNRPGSRGSHLTFTLADTGACSLKDKPLHQLLKRYLTRWSLAA